MPVAPLLNPAEVPESSTLLSWLPVAYWYERLSMVCGVLVTVSPESSRETRCVFTQVNIGLGWPPVASLFVNFVVVVGDGVFLFTRYFAIRFGIIGLCTNKGFTFLQTMSIPENRDKLKEIEPSNNSENKDH